MNLIYTAYEELNNHLNNKLLVKYDIFALYIFIQHVFRISSYVVFTYNCSSITQRIDYNTSIKLNFSYEFFFERKLTMMQTF